MNIHRRAIFGGAVAAVLMNATARGAEMASTMYGLIGKMTAQPGKRATLTQILKDGVAGMPGCLSYVIANDPVNADVLWITEVWETKQAHDAALSLPSVRDAITKGRSLIAGMETVTETNPVGGSGLAVR